jgi:hypothetical protein
LKQNGICSAAELMVKESIIFTKAKEIPWSGSYTVLEKDKVREIN